MFDEIEYHFLNENEADRMRLCYHPEGSTERAVIQGRINNRAELLLFLNEWYERSSKAGYLINEIDECECGCAALKQAKAAASVLMAKPKPIEAPMSDEDLPF